MYKYNKKLNRLQKSLSQLYLLTTFATWPLTGRNIYSLNYHYGDYKRIRKERQKQLGDSKNCFEQTHQSNLELTSKENVDSIGVIASLAVCINCMFIKQLQYYNLQFNKAEYI